jgi:hypothetical protein
LGEHREKNMAKKRAPGTKLSPKRRKIVVEAIKARDPKQPIPELAKSLGITAQTVRYYVGRGDRAARPKPKPRKTKRAQARAPTSTTGVAAEWSGWVAEAIFRKAVEDCMNLFGDGEWEEAVGLMRERLTAVEAIAGLSLKSAMKRHRP